MRRLAILILFCVAVFPGPAKAQVAPTFFYVVTTIDANGLESVFSVQASATLTQGTKAVTLTWVAPAVPAGGAAISGYNVYRSKVTGGSYARINASLVTAVTYADPFVAPLAPSGLTAVAN